MDGKTVDDLILLMFAFAIGLTASGLVSSALAAVAKVQAGFHSPFVRRDNVALSLFITAFAGPVMLFNDARNARSSRKISVLVFTGCMLITAIWVLSLGILVTELAWRLGILVT